MRWVRVTGVMLGGRRDAGTPAVLRACLGGSRRTARGRLPPLGGSIGLTGEGSQGQTDGCRWSDGERKAPPRMVPTGGADQQELPPPSDRDPLQGTRKRVPRRWAMHAGSPEVEVGQDLRADLGLIDENDDTHRPVQRGQTRGSTSCRPLPPPLPLQDRVDPDPLAGCEGFQRSAQPLEESPRHRAVHGPVVV
jgi:hypothetical protein